MDCDKETIGTTTGENMGHNELHGNDTIGICPVGDMVADDATESSGDSDVQCVDVRGDEHGETGRSKSTSIERSE